MCKLDVLPYNSGDKPHGHSGCLVEARYGKAYLVTPRRPSMVIAGVSHSIYAIGKPKKINTLANICDFP